MEDLTLAYALTVHKSKGSQYDTVLFPVVAAFSTMLCRNLLYTAISRARRRVLLYGSQNALGMALEKRSRPRKTQLVAKTRMRQLRCA